MECPSVSPTIVQICPVARSVIFVPIRVITSVLTSPRNRRVPFHVGFNMRVIICHRQKTMVQLARLQAEKHGVRVEIAKDGNDALAKARAERPDVIVLGKDLKNPTTDETVAMLKADPTLRGVKVVIANNAGLDLAKSLLDFGWPKMPTPPKW